jgi:hypothetical protein
VIYNLIGRATVWFGRQYLRRRIPGSALVVVIAAVAGLLVLAGGAALTAGSTEDSDY